MNELIERRTETTKTFVEDWVENARNVIFRTYSEKAHEDINGELVEVENIESIEFVDVEDMEYLSSEVGYE